MPQVRDGGVAVQDLKNKQMNGQDRIELAFAKLVRRFAGGAQDHLRREQPAELTLDYHDRRSEAVSHPWPPVKIVSLSNTIVAGGLCSRKCCKCSYGAEL
jgi:hypothetical protein